MASVNPIIGGDGAPYYYINQRLVPPPAHQAWPWLETGRGAQGSAAEGSS